MTDFLLYTTGAFLGASGAAAWIVLALWVRYRRHGKLWGFKR